MVNINAIGVGMRAVCEVRHISIPQLSRLSGISDAHLLKIGKGSNTPMVSTGFHLADSLDMLLVDLLNISFIRDHNWFIRQPYQIKSPELAAQIATFSSYEIIDDYNTNFSPLDRCRLLLAFQDKMAQFEKPSNNYSYERAEYYRPPQSGSEEKKPRLPERLELGEAYSALRRLTNLSTRKIGEDSGVSVSLLSKFENNLADILLTNFIPIAYTMGLTPDEFVYIAYPPPMRWPLLLPYGRFTNEETLKRITELNMAFSNLSSAVERAEVMVAFKKLARQTSPQEEGVGLHRILSLVKMWLLQPVMITT